MEKIDFWKDKAKNLIDPKLFSDVAENFAQVIEKAGQKIGKDGEPERDKKTGEIRYDKNKRTQLRKFYDEIIRFNSICQKDRAKWDHILPMLNMLIAKAAYAEGRKLISREFVNFIRESVSQLNDPGDLVVFSNFFEAFMGFYRLYGPKN